jgi:hypothetical protein
MQHGAAGAAKSAAAVTTTAVTAGAAKSAAAVTTTAVTAGAAKSATADHDSYTTWPRYAARPD